MRHKIHICEQCSGGGSVTDSSCPHCGALFDGSSSVSLRITQKDVDTITAFLNIMLGNRVVFKDVIRFIRSLSKSYGVSNLDELNIQGVGSKVLDSVDLTELKKGI